VLKPSVCRHLWGGIWPNRHVTFIVAKKSLIYSLSCSIYGICGGEGWLKTSEYRHMGGGGWGELIWTFPFNISRRTTVEVHFIATHIKRTSLKFSNLTRHFILLRTGGAGPIGPWILPHDIVDLRFRRWLRYPGEFLAVLQILRYCW